MNNANQLPITSEILNAACAALAAKRAAQEACAADLAAANAYGIGQGKLAAAGQARAAAKAAKAKETKAERALAKLTSAAALAAEPAADRVRLATLAIRLENAATALAVLEA